MIRNISFAVFIFLFLISSNQLVAQSKMNTLYLNEVAELDSLYSEVLEEQRDFWVQLPDNFNSQRDVKYPVIFILDGHTLMSTLASVYENYWGHYLPKSILVGISNSDNRVRDLTTSVVSERNGGPMNMETGGADKFINFIERELIPYIDNKYPTTTYRTLIGHSFAGLFTVNTLLNHSHLFENYIAIDPSVEWDDQRILKQARNNLNTENLKNKSLFVSLAAEQLNIQDEAVTLENVMADNSEFSLFGRSIIEFSNYMSELEIDAFTMDFKIYPNNLHGTVPLPTIQDGLVFLFDWFQFKHSQKYNNPQTPLSELQGLIKEEGIRLSKHFGYPTPPLVEDLFIGYSFMFMQFELFDKAKYFLESAIKYYPNSDMGYATMAEFYEMREDLKSALKYWKKAFEVSNNEAYQKNISNLQEKLD